VSRAVQALQALERLGVEPLVLCVDVADEGALREAVAQVEQRFSALHGVIHAAGSNGGESFRALSELDLAAYERQLRPRVQGLVALENVLRRHSLDFVLVQSSLSSVLGGLGLAAHAAASRCMDALTQRRAAAQEGTWMSVNWDAWQQVDELQGGGAGRDVSAVTITPAEGAQALHRILWAGTASQVVVSASHLPTRLAQWVERGVPGAADKAGARSSSHARPRLPNPYVAPSSETEQILAVMWQELLGLEQVGAHDNFFQLGGHSLLGTQLITRLRQTFQVELSLRAIFEEPTVAGLALAIEALLIAELDALPDEEAGDLIERSR
jgi:NAD(P)-dependent dehydrogenase (short-subunit alcohol dehydrogenase family)/acyl carrier protein